MKKRLAVRFLALVLGWLGSGAAMGADFDSRSLTLRTALHHDASLEAPFEELRMLYSEGGRDEELRQLYQNHLAQYPADQGARAVHLRLLLAADAPEAGTAAAEATRLHPENAYLHYLAFRATGELASLSQAVILEGRIDRRGPWLRELLDSAIGAKERELVSARLREERDRRLAQAGEGLPELLAWMREGGYLDLARETLTLAGNATLVPEIELEVALQTRGVETKEVAAKRLGDLLERLAADHPRRAELVRARRDLRGDMARPEPTSAEGAVDLATILQDDGKPVDAGQVLAEAALRLPHLIWLEERARPLLEPEPSKWRDYVKRRILLHPERPDLVREQVVLTFSLDGDEAGQAALAAEMERGTAESLSALGTDLLTRGFPRGAVAAFRWAQRMGAQGFESGEGVVRALAAQGDVAGLAKAIEELPIDGVPAESWTRLASFLEGESLESEARELLERGLASQPAEFAAALALAKLAPAERGEELLENSRLLAKDEESYREWLIAAAEFFAGQNKASSLWSREEARLGALAEGIDAAAVRRMATFVEVAAERSQEVRGRRVTAKLLERAGAEIEQRSDIQRLAVTVFAADPSKAPDVERYLMGLLDAEPGASAELRLRLALLYQRVSRPDLAGPQLAQVDWTKIDTVALLDDAVAAFPEIRVRLWQRLSELRPGDVATWEESLNALWQEGFDAEFRAVVGKLVTAEAPIALSEPVRVELEERMLAAWQRELEADLHRGEPEVALRKVRVLARDTEQDWVRWMGAKLLEQTGRTDEAEAWWAQLRGDEAVALRALRSDPQPAEASAPARLAPLSQVGWSFEPLPGSRIANLASTGSTVAILDNRNRVYGLDTGTGKLRWKTELHGKLSGVMGGLFVPPGLVADAGKIFVPAGDRIVALDAASGETLWEGSGGSAARLGLAGQDLLIALFPGSARLVAFDRGTGKLRWNRELDSEIAKLPATAIGFAASGRVVAVLTDRLTVYRAASGDRLWSRRLGNFGALKLDGAVTPVSKDSGARHVAFHGERVVAMAAGGVSVFGVDIPGAGGAGIEGIYLGGDVQHACFQTGEGVEVLDLATAKLNRMAGVGAAVLAMEDLILRRSAGRLVAWHPRTGRRVWETALSTDLLAEEGGTTWWGGVIREERWQGFVIRRSLPNRAVAIPGGLVVAGEMRVEAWKP